MCIKLYSQMHFSSLTMFQDLESSLIAAAVLLSKADHHGSLVEELLDQAKDGDENHHKTNGTRNLKITPWKRRSILQSNFKVPSLIV